MITPVRPLEDVTFNSHFQLVGYHLIPIYLWGHPGNPSNQSTESYTPQLRATFKTIDTNISNHTNLTRIIIFRTEIIT